MAHHGKDFYRILQIDHGATAKEIKSAYYKIALELHPDKNKGCPQKLAAFKQLNEAYGVLSNKSKRSQYDFSTGRRYNANRKSPPPKDYRKVYTSRPPPHWRTAWDHEKHQDMHYGDGIQREFMQRSTERLRKQGHFEYKSPLGKGFTFEAAPLHGEQFNPYSSRSRQGPVKHVFEYEERSNMGGRDSAIRRERIIHDMNARRSERQAEQPTQKENPKRSPDASSPYSQYSAQHSAAAKTKTAPVDDCIIM